MNTIQNYALTNSVTLSTGANQVAFTGFKDKTREKVGNFVIKKIRDYQNWRYSEGCDERLKKLITKNIIHIIYQGSMLGILEALAPSHNVLSFMISKCTIDLGEVIGKKISKDDIKIKHNPLNIFSYLNYIKNKVIG